MAAGSCFAQHIATQMRQRGYSVLDEEPPPFGLKGKNAQAFGYQLYSARYANIYVVRQLFQLMREATGAFEPHDAIWTKNGRFYDAMRPSVEPEGLESAEQVRVHRQHHLDAVRRLVHSVDVLVLTLGLTETWMHRDGTIYPTAPGTIAGSYDPAVHSFKNMTVGDIFEDLCQIRAFLMDIRPDLKILLTVSPVPLTATASGQHVLAATVYSKSVLRAAAGQMYLTFDNVNYFPSYELVASHPSKALYFDDNLRTVTSQGVASVMSYFFNQHTLSPGVQGMPEVTAETPRAKPKPETSREDDEVGVVCEEELLEAFRR